MDILDRVTSLNGSCVYHMKQDFRALDMAKKLMSKAGSLRRTLYKARDIRHYKTVAIA